eukprot:727156-Prorocentrum_lima.AAC.1
MSAVSRCKQGTPSETMVSAEGLGGRRGGKDNTRYVLYRKGGAVASEGGVPLKQWRTLGGLPSETF